MAGKGPSPMKLKADAARRRPYTPAQSMNYEDCPCDDRARPPSWVLDAAADLKFSGGYNTSRSNMCSTCFTVRSANGSCSCP